MCNATDSVRGQAWSNSSMGHERIAARSSACTGRTDLSNATPRCSAYTTPGHPMPACQAVCMVAQFQLVDLDVCIIALRACLDDRGLRTQEYQIWTTGHSKSMAWITCCLAKQLNRHWGWGCMHAQAGELGFSRMQHAPPNQGRQLETHEPDQALILLDKADPEHTRERAAVQGQRDIASMARA